jgi:hypothetical protein
MYSPHLKNIFLTGSFRTGNVCGKAKKSPYKNRTSCGTFDY